MKLQVIYNEDGIDNFFNEKQLLKAPCPKNFTEEGMIALFNDRWNFNTI